MLYLRWMFGHNLDAFRTPLVIERAAGVNQPDFIVTEDGESYGLEVSRATTSEYQRTLDALMASDDTTAPPVSVKARVVPTLFNTERREVNTHHSNPNVVDTDADGFDDGFEVSTGFSPTSASSTPDAFSTVRTAIEYRFGAARGVSYRIEVSTDLVNWSIIEANIAGEGGPITRFYSTESQPRRYFRSRRN